MTYSPLAFLAIVMCVSQPMALSGAQLPALVHRALDFLPEVRADQVVVLIESRELRSYLSAWGYSPDSSSETVQEIKGLAEFTIDHHFPIFINASTWHYQRILKSWETGKFPEQAARVMAADLYHESRHAEHGEDEAEALEAHVALLKKWRAERVLTIADPYIRDLEERLRKERASQAAASARSTIIVRVANPANVPAKELENAQIAAASILMHAGVAIAWIHCPCFGEMGPREFDLHIVANTIRGRLADAMGAAAPGYGCDCAIIFYRVVQGTARDNMASQAIVFGAAIAHEIGHLLLGADAHTPKGIMQASLGRREFEQAEGGGLLFDSRQAQRIRENLSRGFILPGPHSRLIK
jgi:hypothetical protein